MREEITKDVIKKTDRAFKAKINEYPEGATRDAALAFKPYGACCRGSIRGAALAGEKPRRVGR
jgi:hypothetical protein